jgi:hypothetical protein
MPFAKITKGPDKGKYRSPSGKVFTAAQVRRYYARGGSFDRAAMFHDAPYIVDVGSQFVCEDSDQPIISCSCGRDHITDAKLRTRRDPTRTLDLRKSFTRNLDKRWARLGRLITEAVYTQDMFGLVSANARALQIIAMNSGRVNSFQMWIDAALADTILGLDREQWIGHYIREAYTRGWTTAQLQVGRDLPLNIDRADIITKLTIAELQGVIEAFSQRAVRAFSDGLLAHLPPAKIARAIRMEMAKVGVVRSRATVQAMIVRANGEASLDYFQSAGHTHVEILPESIPSPGRVQAVRDAARRKRRARRAGGEYVEVLTAGDDDVCVICEDIAASGPYLIDDARGLIPAHPWCRCAFIPAFDKRFAHGDAIAFRDWNPDQPRNERGEWTEEEVIEMAKTHRELLAKIRAKRAKEQKGEAFVGLPGEHAQSVELTHGYRAVRKADGFKVGQIFRDPNEATLARDVSLLVAGEGSQVWEVDISDIEGAEADGAAVYLPAGTSFEVVGFDQQRGIWQIDAQ